MTERDAAMRKIAETGFAAYDSALFCDAHPYDKQAISYFHNSKRMYTAAMDAYMEKYGPVTLSQQKNPDYFDWVDGPWPWEVTD